MMPIWETLNDGIGDTQLVVTEGTQVVEPVECNPNWWYGCFDFHSFYGGGTKGCTYQSQGSVLDTGQLFLMQSLSGPPNGTGIMQVMYRSHMWYGVNPRLVFPSIKSAPRALPVLVIRCLTW
jgi:hypothetical protein